MTFKPVEKPEPTDFENYAEELNVDLEEAHKKVGKWFHEHRSTQWSKMFDVYSFDNYKLSASELRIHKMVLAECINTYIFKNNGEA